MRLDQIFARRTRTLSFEFYPPKSDRTMLSLEDAIQQLAVHGPDFVSVTYGAGGSTRDKTRTIIENIQSSTSLTAMAHLTCVNATKAELRVLLDEFHAAGIENILALRGDPPKGQQRFTPTDGGCEYAADLVELIQTDGRFAITCAAFPERHPDASDCESDWQNLRNKLAKGASAAITQCFFEATPYLELQAWLIKNNQQARIIPGILPVVNWAALKRFCGICQATIPESLSAIMEPLAQDPVAARKAGMAFTINLCDELLKAGAPGLHIYCLNQASAAAELVTALRQRGHDL